MALNIENIIAEIKEASILELNDLVKAIEEEFGVTAAAPVAAAAAGAAAVSYTHLQLVSTQGTQSYLPQRKPCQILKTKCFVMLA